MLPITAMQHGVSRLLMAAVDCAVCMQTSKLCFVYNTPLERPKLLHTLLLLAVSL